MSNIGKNLVSFGAKYIQKGRRLTLQASLLENLGVREGDSVQLFFNTKEKTIVIKKTKD